MADKPLVGTSPTNFGVQRMLRDDMWKPEADVVLDAVAKMGYDGIALGPPGYLGTRATLDQSLADRDLALVEAFLPFHFSRDEVFEDEFARLPDALALLSGRGEDGPYAVLSEGFREPGRWERAGRISGTSDERLSSPRFATLLSNLHRVAETCRCTGVRPVLHHHAGTLIESDYEIRRIVEAMDTDLVGLCLDTAHAWLGGADPRDLLNDYAHAVQHVHLKDLSFERVAAAHRDDHNLTEMTLDHVFVAIGTGNGQVAAVVDKLIQLGYRGWFVIEHDRLLLEGDTLEPLIAEQRHNLEVVRSSARTTA